MVLFFIGDMQAPDLPSRRSARGRHARHTTGPGAARRSGALLASYSAASVSALIADISAANTAGGTNTITLTAATTAPTS